jgi:hypothetical protein
VEWKLAGASWQQVARVNEFQERARLGEARATEFCNLLERFEQSACQIAVPKSHSIAVSTKRRPKSGRARTAIWQAPSCRTARSLVQLLFGNTFFVEPPLRKFTRSLEMTFFYNRSCVCNP